MSRLELERLIDESRVREEMAEDVKVYLFQCTLRLAGRPAGCS